jgi:superfamily II DNA or RNA helicase
VSVTLRPYQLRALAEAREAFRARHRSVVLVSPTGSGKTTIGAEIARGAVEKGGRVVWFAHRVELVSQAAARLREFGLPVGPGQPVQVLSTQAVVMNGSAPDATLAVLDECHHYVSDEWKRIPDAYRARGSSIVGLTATPERADGLGLSGAFESLVVVAQIGELTDLGYLVACELVVPKGTVGKGKISEDPWKVYQRYGAGRSCVVFAPSVKAAEAYAADFRTNKIGAAVVEAGTSPDERADILARFADGEISVLCNVAVLTEGWDCPRAKVCVLARKIGSPSLYLQCVGRVLRPWAGVGGKATLIDLAGNVELHGDPAEERVWSLEGAACTRKGERDGVRFCKVCKCEIPPSEERCPDCDRPVSEIAIPHSAHMEMMRLERVAKRDEWAATLKPDKRRTLLAGFYAAGIEKEWKRGAAEHKYAAIMKHRPDAALRAAAWHEAQAKVAATKGDAWEGREGP